MTLYEYREESLGIDATWRHSYLNQLARKGWRIVGFCSREGYRNSLKSIVYDYLLERELKQ